MGRLSNFGSTPGRDRLVSILNSVSTSWLGPVSGYQGLCRQEDIGRGVEMTLTFIEWQV